MGAARGRLAEYAARLRAARDCHYQYVDHADILAGMADRMMRLAEGA